MIKNQNTYQVRIPRTECYKKSASITIFSKIKKHTLVGLRTKLWPLDICNRT